MPLDHTPTIAPWPLENFLSNRRGNDEPGIADAAKKWGQGKRNLLQCKYIQWREKHFTIVRQTSIYWPKFKTEYT